MERWRFDYTIESTVGKTVIIEAEDEYDALEKFDCMREDLILDNADDVRRIGNMRITDDPYYEKL